MNSSDVKHDPQHQPHVAGRPAACAFCGYDVRTIPITQPCPECGSIIALSLGLERYKTGVRINRTGTPPHFRRLMTGLSCTLAMLVSMTIKGPAGHVLLVISACGLLFVLIRSFYARTFDR